MKDEVAVNHPSHYEKGNGHIECIDLLAILCRGYRDIYANEIGQTKYLYRAGSKKEADLTIEEKMVQDIKKLEWYLNDFYNRAAIAIRYNNKDFCDVVYYNGLKEYIPFQVELLKKEFTFDKPSEYRGQIEEIVSHIYRFEDLQDVKNTLTALRRLIDVLAKTEA